MTGSITNALALLYTPIVSACTSPATPYISPQKQLPVNEKIKRKQKESLRLNSIKEYQTRGSSGESQRSTNNLIKSFRDGQHEARMWLVVPEVVTGAYFVYLILFKPWCWGSVNCHYLRIYMKTWNAIPTEVTRQEAIFHLLSITIYQLSPGRLCSLPVLLPTTMYGLTIL